MLIIDTRTGPARPMPTITVLRQPRGKLGCRVSPDNTVSEVHAGSAAQAAGLQEGWQVKAINGKLVTPKDAAQDILAELVKQSVFKFQFDVDKPAPLTKAAVAVVHENDSGHVAAEQNTLAPAAVGGKGKSSTQAIKEVKRKSAEPAPEAKRTKATAAQPPVQAKGAALSVSNLTEIIRSDAIDVCSDLCKRLDAGDADAIALLTKMYPLQVKKSKCVFCGSKFVPGGSSPCSVVHDVDEFGGYDRTCKSSSGNYGTFSGSCSRCCETVYADGPEDDGPDTRDIEECYCGPHSSNPFDLKAFRIERMGQVAHDEWFGSDDAEYK